jgi:hypothetical protein
MGRSCFVSCEQSGSEPSCAPLPSQSRPRVSIRTGELQVRDCLRLCTFNGRSVQQDDGPPIRLNVIRTVAAASGYDRGA